MVYEPKYLRFFQARFELLQTTRHPDTEQPEDSPKRLGNPRSSWIIPKARVKIP
jgi:hypothetical protein